MAAVTAPPPTRDKVFVKPLLAVGDAANAAVTDPELMEDSTFPPMSHTDTTGCGERAMPFCAVVVPGCVVTVNLLGAPIVKVKALLVTDVNAGVVVAEANESE